MKHFALTFSIFSLLVLSTFISTAYAHGRVFVGGGVIIGQPYYAYPPYYGYPYYAYPPAGYAPAYVGPYTPPAPTAYDQYYRGTEGQNCREYRRTINIGGQLREAYGHACHEPDGSWRIID